MLRQRCIRFSQGPNRPNGCCDQKGMEYRTLALLVVLVIAFAATTILMPKPASIDDPEWVCPTRGPASAWACVRKPN